MEFSQGRSRPTVEARAYQTLSCNALRRCLLDGQLGVVLFGVLSPATASGQNGSAVLTSHSPWLAPTGHRQPARADVPQNEVLSAWDREQQVLDAELERKRIICRGC
jgi:hypothetical protein